MGALSEASLTEWVRRTAEIPGWLSPADSWLFNAVARLQSETGVAGNLLEVGVFAGKSAVLLEALREQDETLVVCDLFETPASASENREENRSQYDGLTRRQFEETFLRFHPFLPAIHQCRSDELQERLTGEFRFLHVDGSHLFDVVRTDIQLVLRVANAGAVIVLDDYRAPHTPGVAAAAWEAVAQGRLHPFCLSAQKLYACAGAGAATGYREAMQLALAAAGIGHTQQLVQHGAVLVVWWPSPRRLQRLTRLVTRTWRDFLRRRPLLGRLAARGRRSAVVRPARGR